MTKRDYIAWTVLTILAIGYAIACWTLRNTLKPWEN